MNRRCGFEIGDASWYAADVLREVGMADVPGPNALAVAEKLGLPVRSVPRASIDCPGELSFDPSKRPFLRVWNDLSPQALQFVVGLLLGYWCLTKRKLVRIDERGWSRRFSGALLAPDASLWTAWLESADILQLCVRFPLVPSTSLMMRLRDAGVGRVFLFDLDYDKARMDPMFGILDRLNPPKGLQEQVVELREMMAKDPLAPAILREAGKALLRGWSAMPGIHAARLPDYRARIAVVLSCAA